MYQESRLLQAIPDTVLHISRQGIILDFKSSGHQPPDIPTSAIGKSISEFFPKSFVEQFKLYSEFALASGDLQYWEYEIPNDHLLLHQEARLVPLGRDQVVVIIRDITNRQQAYETSRQSEHYYKHLIQNLQVGVLIQSPSGEILLSNLGAQRLLDVSETQLLGKRLTELDFEITGEADTTGVVDTLRDHITTGQALQNLVLCVYHPQTGYRAWMLVNIVPELDANGIIQYVVVTLSDITDFKNMAAALRTSEEQYELLVNSISEGLFLIDIEGCWLFLNAAWETITGYRPSECIGVPVRDSVDPQDHEIIESAFAQLLKRETSDCHLEIRLITKEQVVRWVEMRLRLILNETNNPIGYTGTLSDITERKVNEEHLFQLAVKSKLVEIQRQLLSDISHDIRTPLSVIGTSSYILNRQLEDGKEYQKYLDNIEEQIQVLKEILEKTSTVAQLIHGSVDFSFVRTQINDLIRQVISKNEAAIRQKQHTLQLDLQPNIRLIDADQKWVTEMLDNLLMNSIRYTPQDGTISITTEEISNYINITIKDTGIGMESEDLQHIFEPFYKGDKARSEKDRTFGLGLTVVNSVIEAHGGSVTFDSKIGQGTTVLLRFPINVNDFGAHETRKALRLK
ncbi:MAG: PAS domain S-box protein [Chloroflexota bacterium]